MAERCPCSSCCCPCACTNVTIMQLFHELKQKFPAVPDRVINECIQKNGHRHHDREACESALEKENHTYLLHSYPPSLASKMNAARPLSTDDVNNDSAANDCLCCHAGVDAAAAEENVSRFDRRLPGRQSLDSLCRRQQNCIAAAGSALFKHHRSDEHLHLQRPVPPPSIDKSSVSFHPSAIIPPGSEHTSCSVTRNQLFKCTHCCSSLSPAKNDLNLPSHSRQWAWSIGNRGDLGSGCGNFCEHHSEEVNCEASECPANGNNSKERNVRDVRLEFASDHQCFKRTSVSVLSSTSSCAACRCLGGRGLGHAPHSAPVTPSGCRPPPVFPPVSLDVTTQRHRTALSVEPAPPYLAQVEPQSHRPFTKVNLTLRPPSTDPQPPIDIQSTAGGGLTYLTCSYDPQQGYRSRLQISIGPGSHGSVSAVRAGNASPSLPLLSRLAAVTPDADEDRPCPTAASFDVAHLEPAIQATVSKQLQQKQRLERELQTEKERLKVMKQKVADMEQDLRNRSPIASRHTKVQNLKEEILRLRAECKAMTAEVDLSSVNPVPLGETREDFYRDIYRGPDGTCHTQSLPGHESEARGAADLGRHHVVGGAVPPNVGEGAGAGPPPGDGPNWTCYVCTFRNHPLLDKCEQCEMPRIVLGTSSSQPSGAGGDPAGRHSQQLSIDGTSNKVLPPNIVH